MKFTEKKKKLPDFISPSLPVPFSWVKEVLLGEANIVSPSVFSSFSTFPSFLSYVLSNRNTVTISTSLRELDHVFELAGPDFCKSLTVPGMTWVNFGSYSIRLGPGGRSLAKGIRKITVRQGNKYGYVRDVQELCSSLCEIIPTFNLLLDFGLLPPSTPTISSLSRNLLSSAPSKIRGRNPLLELPKSLLEHALSTFRLGRFETLLLGTTTASIYDKTSAYPKILSSLNCVYEPFTEWFSITNLKNFNLLDPSIIYGYFYISAEVPDTDYISPLSFRAQLFFSLMEVFCHGKIDGVFVGLETLRLLRELEIPFQILSGWIGIGKKAYRPYARILRDISAGRNRDDRLFKLIGSRFVGSMAGSYLNIKGNKVDRVGLDVWCPLYSAAVVDSMFAEVTRLALSLPQDSVYRFSIDSLTTSPGALDSTLPNSWRVKEMGKITIWNEKFVDTEHSTRWADSFDGTYLHMKEIGRPSLKGTFGKLVNLDRRWKRFLSEDTTSIKILPGTRKRRTPSFQDFLSSSIPTTCYSLSDLYSAWSQLFIDHDEDIIEGEGILYE